MHAVHHRYIERPTINAAYGSIYCFEDNLSVRYTIKPTLICNAFANCIAFNVFASMFITVHQMVYMSYEFLSCHVKLIIIYIEAYAQNDIESPLRNTVIAFKSLDNIIYNLF